MRYLLIFLLLALPLQAQTKIKLGYVPNFWFLQSAVIEGQRLDLAHDIDIEFIRFPSPAANLQGFASKQTDGMLNNSAAALLAMASGEKLKLVSSLCYGDITLIARKALLGSSSPQDAIMNFAQTKGRSVKIISNPRGSLSDLMLKYWVAAQKPELQAAVEIIHAADQPQLQQIFLNDAADIISSFEPLTSVILTKVKDAGILVKHDSVRAKQPGGILVVRDSYLERQSDSFERSLRTIFKTANEFVLNNPDAALSHIEHQLMKGLVPAEILRIGLNNMTPFLVSDPTAMLEELQFLKSWMCRLNYIPCSLDIATLLK